MHMSLQCHPSYAVVSVEGWLSVESVDSVIDLFSLVPLDQSLILDLCKLDVLDAGAAGVLTAEIRSRSGTADVAVVVDDTGVAASLVLEDLHHSVPFVRLVDDAVTLVTRTIVATSC